MPPIVSAEITLDIAIVSHLCQLSSRMVTSLTTIAAPHAPEMMPKMSPITSLQTLATFSLFLTSHIAVFAPYTFFDAIETMGVISHDVTATPMPSKSMLAVIRNSKSITVTIMLSAEDVISVRKLMKADKNSVTTVILTAHRLRFFLGFFFSLPSFCSELPSAVLSRETASETSAASVRREDMESLSWETLSLNLFSVWIRSQRERNLGVYAGDSLSKPCAFRFGRLSPCGNSSSPTETFPITPQDARFPDA